MPAVWYALTISIGAFLLFWVELFFARLLLPLLGGTPAVWNTCLFFFQAMLLVGYAYSHASSRLSPRRQVIGHGVLLLLPWLFIPIQLASGWSPPTDGAPIPFVLGLLAASLAVPFVVVSTMSPLLQAWYARLDRDDSHDPYPLYAASNAGSLLALVSYPFPDRAI